MLVPNNRLELAKSIADIILNHSHSKYKIQDIILFGSLATGQRYEAKVNEQSRRPDIDMLILHNENQQWSLFREDFDDMLREFETNKPCTDNEVEHSDEAPGGKNLRVYTRCILDTLGSKYFVGNNSEFEDGKYLACLITVALSQIYDQESLTEHVVDNVFTPINTHPNLSEAVRYIIAKHNIVNGNYSGNGKNPYAVLHTAIDEVLKDNGDSLSCTDILAGIKQIEKKVSKKVKSESALLLVENLLEGYDMDKLLDLHVLPICVFEPKSSLRDYYMANCVDATFWHNVLSSGKLYDSSQKEFKYPVSIKYNINLFDHN